MAPRKSRFQKIECLDYGGSCGCGADTHGDVLDVHTREREREVIVSSTYQKSPRRVITCPTGSTKVTSNHWMLHILSLGIGREQHVVQSSIYSLHLNTLPNSRHMIQQHSTVQHSDNTHTQHRTCHTEAKRREEEMKETKRDINEKRYK